MSGDSNFEFDDMEAFWDYIKAQGTQTAFVWERLSDTIKDKIRILSPSLHANLEALSAGNKAAVRKAEN